MYVAFQKILVFVLFFHGFNTVHGFDFLSNLRDAVLSAESVVGDIFTNVIKVAQKFRSLNDVFNAAVEEHCVFRCPNGKFL